MRGTLRALLIGLLLAGPALGAPPEEPFQEIRVHLPSDASVRELRAVPGLEVMGFGDGDIRLLSRPSHTRELVDRGWVVEMIHEDLQAFYAGRQKAAGPTGVWHTYEDVVAELERLRENHPEIVSAPFSIGRSLEGREIWAIRISDNPDSLEDEPEVLFDGVHHAREIMAVETILAFANYLCENDATDPVVREIVEHRQTYLVPIVNPDGFVYNELTSPGGGGMWRKNRRPNGGDCFGVDVNRNYPFQWGRDDGSSSVPCADDYRGPQAGSEPETRAMTAFVNAHRFVTHDSIHSVAGMVLFPWCYTDEPAPDEPALRLIAREMARPSGYQTGQCPEILYSTSGDFIDWTYGQTQEHPSVISLTTEIGGTGFWPDPSEKDALIDENLPSLLYLAQIAGPALRVEEIRVLDQNGDRQLFPGESGRIAPTLSNDGVIAAAVGVTVSLRCDDPYVTLTHASASIPSIGPGETEAVDADSLAFRVEEGCPRGRRAPFTLVVTGAGDLHLEVPMELAIGESSALYEHDFETSSGAWMEDPSTTATAGLFVRVDPNPTSFQPGEDTTPAPGIHAWITGQNTSEGDGDVDGGAAAARSPLIDLSEATGAHLSMNYFHGQRDGGDDPEGDFFHIDISSDGGENWVTLVSIGDQASVANWRTLSIDLENVIELTDRVCLRVQVSDGPADGDLIEGGIDEVRIVERGLQDHPPAAPMSIDPPDGASGLSVNPTLRVADAADEEGDPVTYGFRVFADPDLTELVSGADGIVESPGETAWQLPMRLENGTYYWRAYAADPFQRSLYGEIRSFGVTDTSGVPPGPSTFIAGPNPMRGSIRIRYPLDPTLTSSLTIHDAQGRFVRDLDVVPSQSGWVEVEWDGRDASGRSVPSGPYWARLRTPGETRTLQIIRVR